MVAKRLARAVQNGSGIASPIQHARKRKRARRSFRGWRIPDEKVTFDQETADKLTLRAGLDPGDRRQRPHALRLLRDAEKALANAIGLTRSIAGGPARSDQRKRLSAL